MRPGPAVALLSLACVLAGGLLWTTGKSEQRVVTAKRALLALNYDAARAALERPERSAMATQLLPGATGLQRIVAEQRAQASYWTHDYGAVATDGTLDGASGVTRLLAVNAAFRRVKLDGSDRGATDRLQEVAAQYVELLRAHPDLVEAAYNYEFVTRTRERLSRPRGARGPRVDLPPIQTLHGAEGASPAPADMGDFKVIIPQNPQERQQRPESGAGGAKVRKG